VEGWKEYLTLGMELNHTYHDHKENMAHAIFLVNVAFVGALLGTGGRPSWLPKELTPPWVVGSLCVGAWLLIHRYLRWQLRNRRIAAIKVAAFSNVLRDWIATPPTLVELRPVKKLRPVPGQLKLFLDNWVVPVDTGIGIGDDDVKTYPKCVVGALDKQATGAVKAECMVSLGSIILVVLLMAKLCFSYTPGEALAPPSANASADHAVHVAD